LAPSVRCRLVVMTWRPRDAPASFAAAECRYAMRLSTVACWRAGAFMGAAHSDPVHRMHMRKEMQRPSASRTACATLRPSAFAAGSAKSDVPPSTQGWKRTSLRLSAHELGRCADHRCRMAVRPAKPPLTTSTSWPVSAGSAESAVSAARAPAMAVFGRCWGRGWEDCKRLSRESKALSLSSELLDPLGPSSPSLSVLRAP